MSRKRRKSSSSHLNKAEGVGGIELMQYGPRLCGIFSFVEELHIHEETNERYKVKIYSSVLNLIENNDEIKQQLSCNTFRLLRLNPADVAFVQGAQLGVAEDFLIWHNLKEQHFYWFTVTQAKSYFGDEYDGRFGHVERQDWSRS